MALTPQAVKKARKNGFYGIARSEATKQSIANKQFMDYRVLFAMPPGFIGVRRRGRRQSLIFG
jgi:hypothetical protein